MSELNVVSLEDALRARSEPSVSVSLEALQRHQATIPMDRCHAAFVNLSYELELKTQRIPVFHDLSAAFPRGRKIALLGHSGAGKGTILELLQQRIAPTKGHVHIKSRISWPAQSMQFLDQRLSVRDNASFLSSVIGLSQRKFMNAVIEFCDLNQKSLNEPVRNLPIWARRRLAFLTLVSCNFDLHLMAQPFRPQAMSLTAAETAHAEALLFGRDYLITLDQPSRMPANCDLVFILYNGWLYGFDDVGEAASVFDALPVPKSVSSRKQTSEEDDDDDEAGEMLI